MLLLLIIFAAIPSIQAESPYRYGNCSEAFVICDPLAECVETKSNSSFQCICGEGSRGDGFQSSEGCFFDVSPCVSNDDCHVDGFCDLAGDKVCKCKPFYAGDGDTVCLDIEECLGNPCHPDANCKEEIGAEPVCTCKGGFKGDGINCEPTCFSNQDCHALATCTNEACVCNSGYEGDGFTSCTDINECVTGDFTCVAPAQCKNTQGDYECGCPNGFSGDGQTCVPTPVDCHEIFLNDATAVSGRIFEIDTDGTGPLDAMKVKCEFKDNVGITIVAPVNTAPLTVTGVEVDVAYKDVSLEQVTDLVSKSNFCYQEQWLECSNGYDLFLDDIFVWTDGNGNTYNTWGGSSVDHQCPCGELGFCEQGDACNCDGTSTTTGYDFGKIINSSMLPIATLQFNTGSGSAKYKLSEVYCAPQVVNILKDCDQIKNDGVSENGPQLIDIDGPTGTLAPTLVHCDMTKYGHVGLTVIPHDIRDPVEPTGSGNIDLSYNTPVDVIQGIIELSTFCSQNIRYECQNAPIHYQDEQKVYVLAGNDSVQLDYFPGGEGHEGLCGCGLTRSCEDLNVTCNCDIVDDVLRYDIANHTVKEDLPITSIYVDLSLDNSYARVVIGPLICSEQQFGIEPNCEKYRAIGVSEPYSYLIDPDGPADPDKPLEVNLPPFEVECQFNANPPQGVTIIHHDYPDSTVVDSTDFMFEIVYKNIQDNNQINNLKGRSTFCGQSLDFNCTDFKLHTAPGTGVVWRDLDGNMYTYLSGGASGDDGCQCNIDQFTSCADGNEICNCDAASGGTFVDDGELGNITHLPVAMLDFTAIRNQGGSLEFTLGPLKCFETFPTCYDLSEFLKAQALIGEATVEPGKYTIDPDRSGDNPPFTVTCDFPYTIVGVSPAPTTGPAIGSTQCYTVDYLDYNNNSITGSQIAALVASSAHCTQLLSYSCENAPWTGNVNYTTCDGRAQDGWALSGGHDSCACGMTGTCFGGLNDNCNCDTVDGNTRKDEGVIYNNTRLPVCEVCLTLDPVDAQNPAPGNTRSSSYNVGSLTCSGTGFVGEDSCQDRRIASSKSGVTYINPGNSKPVIPVYCNMIASPKIGIMEFRLNQTDYSIPAGEGIDIEPAYFGYSQSDMEALIDKSYYCTQEIYIDCNDGSLDLSGSNGWYSRAGVAQDTWGGNIGKVDKCFGIGTNCNCNKPGVQTDGGILGEKTKLPISRVVLGPSPTPRTLRIEPVKCYELRPDCYHIMISGNLKTPYSSPTLYVIDPDGPDGVDPFTVRCEFQQTKNNAITKVAVTGISNPYTQKVADNSHIVPLTYTSASYDQVNALAMQAPFCHQDVEYKCTKSPINGSVQYFLYGNTLSTGFGTGYETNSSVCPCSSLGYCDGFACRCDEKLATQVTDSGIITDKDLLPITYVAIGGQVDADATSTLKVSEVRCEQQPSDFPKNCEQARNNFGYTTSGEVMIYPTTSMDPFFVYCDMQINPGHGTIVLKPDIEPNMAVNYDGVPVDVRYQGLTDAQVSAIVTASSRCYQPVRYDCMSTRFVFADKFTWTSPDSSVNRYFGAGTQTNKDCTCGNENLCGGDGGRTTMEARACNCEIGDDENRVDSGIMSIKNDLPVTQFTFESTGIPGSNGNITIGSLYCAQHNIDFDECALGFHDCHKWANCMNTNGGFNCLCNAGFRGLGVPDVYANGRQCYDDDECSFNPCPSTATCTNTPGSFFCTCNKGYEKTGPTTCRNIDECTEVQYPNNCDVNAKCFDTEGSFYCKCKRGFRGEGTNGTCEGVGICACFGDPHCISFDDKWLNFMGDCQYIMAQDGCDGSLRTFSVWTHNWDMDSDIQGITWVKDVTVNINNTRIYLGPDRVIRINGREFLGYRRDGISVDDNGREVVITTDFGLEVAWDGGDEVEIFLPKEYGGKTCGLCGDFDGDINNDWRIGDYCTASKGQITPNENIFGHSWAVQEYLNAHPTCVADCNAAPTDYSACEDPVFNYYCDRVFDPEISPFKDCLEVMDAPLLDNLRFSCVFDICQVSNDIELGMCSSAERVVNECNKNLDTETGLWRKLGFCEIQCGDNEEYRTCGPNGYPAKTRQPLCYDIRTGSQPYVLEYCAEGCYCVPGYVLEGQRCVLPTECGCIKDGVYLAVDQTYINDECTSVSKCLSGGTVSEVPIQCSEFATCGLDTVNAVFGCNCNDGYKGNGIDCGEDNCYNVTCPTNMECMNGICQCKKGYTGDCNRCDDIDECATKTDDCIHIGQNCTNNDGGYECVCIQGYVPYGHYCLDIDECEAGFDDCGVNSECVNTHGGFQCECCAGYVHNGASCVSDGSIVPNGVKCCSCQGIGCSTDGKVCGDDGKTYTHEKALRVASCRTDVYIDVSYKGECKADCTGVVCDRPYEVCTVDPLLNKAVCECPKCDGSGSAVCSSRLVLFKSQCEFENVMCEIQDNTTYIEADVTLCDKATGDAVSQWSDWSDCSVDCGAGEMTRMRVELRTRTTYEKQVQALDEVAICYGNCTSGPCFEYNCTRYGEVCVPSTDNLTPECICRNCTYREDDPICGLVGDKQSTFKNKCELQKKACEVDQKPHLLSTSPCGALPLNCSLYSKYQDLSEGSCISIPIAVGTCEGGCGVNPDYCCEIESSEMKSYSLTCSNGTVINREVNSVLSCKCDDLSLL